MRLPLSAVATLLAFGAAANLLYLRAGHIAYSCALHAAWNLARFGTTTTLGGLPLTQTRSFALIEGSELALVAAVAVLCAALGIEWFGREAVRPGSGA